METDQEASIDHLDFPAEETEEKEEEELKHYTHPINPNTYWCGAPRKNTGYFANAGDVLPESRTCVGCLQLYIKHGGEATGGCEWWWKVHRAWYSSGCKPANHDCGA